MSIADRQRLVVLLSGRGSNYRALQAAEHDMRWSGRIVGVISDRPEAAGLERACLDGVKTHCVDRAHHSDRAGFEQALQRAIDAFQPRWIVLAGFMRVLSADLVRHYEGRMINIHPSLLPRYRGLHTHQRVLDAGEKETGASVHFVTPELDGGPVLSQVRMTVQANDNAQTLAERLLPLEHRLLPATVALLTKHLVELRHEAIIIDGKKLLEPLRLGTDLSDHGELIGRRGHD